MGKVAKVNLFLLNKIVQPLSVCICVQEKVNSTQCPHETKYIYTECALLFRMRDIRGNGLMADCLISLLIVSLVRNPQQALIVQLRANVLR